VGYGGSVQVEGVTEAAVALWERMSKEERAAALKEWTGFTPEQKELTLLADRGKLVQELPVGADGFEYWYLCAEKKELPPYVKTFWVPNLIEAWKNKSGVLLEGFRGATKSSVLFWWVLYLQGKNAVGNSVLVRISDQKAKESSNSMAAVIESSIAWKLCFPNIVPDKDRGWSTEGLNLKDTSVDYPTWVQKVISDHKGEASILCAGITSGMHVGTHPSNGWYADDFHDEQNTRSVREMESIVTTIEKNIIPTWTRPGGHPTLAVACTLWDDNDGYHSLLRTGLFKHVQTPIYVLDEAGDIYPDIVEDGVTVFRGADSGKRVRSSWPEAFPPHRIVEIEKQNPVWFPVMYLCNLESLKGTVLKREWIHRYPADKIDASWPVYFGIDFASSDDKIREKERDYFALAVGAAIPGGGVVLIDGLRGKWPAAESIAHIKAFAAKYPSLVSIGVEKWGKGETFKDMLLYSTSLPVVPCPFQGTPTKSKGQRYQAEGGLAPMFTDGRMWVSSDAVSFFGSFEEEWVSWDGTRTKTDHDDCLDAVYWMAYIAQGHLVPAKERESIGVTEPKKPNPWSSLGRRK
jgi:hypothetical protein